MTKLACFLLCLPLIGCSADANQKGKGGAAPARPATSTTTATPLAKATDTRTGTSTSAETSPPDEAFVTWCEKAAETKPAQSELKAYHALFCAGGPTKLLTTDLIATAFSGSGDPDLQVVQDWQHASGTSAVTYGIALALPIPIKRHFDIVGPKNGEEAELKKLTEAGGATGTGKVLQSFSNDGPYHVRGWSIDSDATKTFGPIPIKVHTIGRADQYQLVDGSAYLYTQYVTESKDTIKTFDLYTAGVEVDGKSYLIALARIESTNLGFAQVAEQTIEKTARDVVKVMYQAAVDAEQ